MRLDTLKYFYDSSSEQNPSFYYRGPFLEKFTNTILEVSNGSSARENPDGVGKKVSFMLVECFQNILKHAENIQNIDHILNDEGLFSFKNISGAFVINSINVIQNNEVEKLTSLVEQVNSFNNVDLKQFYLENLKNNTMSEKGGAGLGLIEMARKSGQKILHNINALDDTFSLFHQQITLRRNCGDEIDVSNQLDESFRFYNRMTKENLVLLYKGDFSQKSILPLLELAEHNVTGKSHGQKKTLKAAHVTIEVLQNISKHSKLETTELNARFGIFMLGINNDSLCVLAGNVVSLSEKIFLEEKLEYLVSLDNDELRQLHRSALQATLRFESKSNAGLGLIEVAQASTERLNYRFYPFEKDKYLFVLEVVI